MNLKMLRSAIKPKHERRHTVWICLYDNREHGKQFMVTSESGCLLAGSRGRRRINRQINWKGHKGSFWDDGAIYSLFGVVISWVYTLWCIQLSKSSNWTFNICAFFIRIYISINVIQINKQEGKKLVVKLKKFKGSDTLR